MPVRKSQICKFLWLMCKSKIRKFLQNNTQLCSKTVLKVAFLNDFFIMYKVEWEHYMLILHLWEENLRACGNSKTATHQIKFGSQITNSQFAELICWPPTFFFAKYSVLSREMLSSGKWFFCRMKVTEGTWRTPWRYLVYKKCKCSKIRNYFIYLLFYLFLFYGQLVDWSVAKFIVPDWGI